MTRESILAALEHARGLVASLESALAALDGRASSAPAPSLASPTLALAPANEWIDTARAARISRVTYSTLYRWARRFPGLGEKTESGQWRFRRAMLISIASISARRGEDGECGDALPLQVAKAGDHSRDKD